MMRLKNNKGFTLAELTVVIVIIGILAAFAVPMFRVAVERSKASEAFSYLSSVQSAQERYRAHHGTYANQLINLDIKMRPPKYFSVGAIVAGSTSGLEDFWSLTLTRQGVSAGYGAYTVTFTEEGFDATTSTITGMPDINPIGT